MANEKRLIDANVVLAKKFTTGLSDASGNHYGNADVIFADDIENAPTVDAVPVVRCRECKHLNVLNRKELYAKCSKTNTVFLPFKLDTREHFCSLGERKDGDENGLH